MKAELRKLEVDLPVEDDEDLSSPPPNGARFNWKTLKLEIPPSSFEEVTSLMPMGKFALVRSRALTDEEWANIIAARKVLLTNNSIELPKLVLEKPSDNLSESIELAGEGE